MEKCPWCGYRYPEGILSPFVVNGKWSPPICGICALEGMRKAHLARNYMFIGEIALEYYHLALEERRRQSERGSNKN